MKKFIIVILLLYIPGLVLAGSGEPEWNWVRPKPTGNDLQSVKFINNLTGYACGNNGDVIKTTDGGTSWSLLETPTRNRLNGIYATQSGKVVVVGDSATMLQSYDHGNTWTQISNIPSNVRMTSVKIVNESVAYACGFSGTIVFQSHIFKTTDGGSVWTQLPNSPNSSVYSVNFYSENYGLISGGNSAYITHNGGQSWSIQSIAFVLISAGKCITFRDSLTIGITFAGMNSFVTTTNGGQNWIKYDINLPNIGDVIDILEGHTFVDNSTGYIVSRYGRVLKSTNGGVNWQFQETYTNLWWIESLSEDFVIACGYGGTILKSTDSGNTWNKLLGAYQPLNHLVFVNQSTGFSCGNRGSIIKTTDVGETWQDLNSGVTVKLNQLHFINETTGYCVGDTGTFLKTTNAGDTWEVQNSETSNEIYSVYFHNEQNGVITPMGGFQVTTDGGNSWQSQFVATFARFISIIFLNENTGMATAGPIYRTENGGFNWFEVFNVNSYEANIFFVDNEYGFYLGRNRIARTSNGGANWVHKVINYDFGRRNIYFGSRYIGLASYGSGFSGGMNKTTDGGDTWFDYQTVSANANNWIIFTNANTGIAVDWRGCIIKTTNELITNVETVSNIVPDKFELFQNYPNPFNPVTTIKYSLPVESFVSLKVYNVLGQIVQELVSEVKSSGTYYIEFNGSKLPSGVYYYQIKSGDFIETKKIMLLK